MNRFSSGGRAELEFSDRAYWPMIERDIPGRGVGTGAPRYGAVDVVSAPASKSPLAELLANNCGKEIVERSWWVGLCPMDTPRSCDPSDAPSLTGNVVLLQRDGVWRVWFAE